MNKPELSLDQIKDIMADVLEFYRCQKHGYFENANLVAAQVAKSLKVLGFTPLDFKKTVEKMSDGKPMPANDKFYMALTEQYKEIENET